MTRRYMVVLEPGDDGWIAAEVPALPGCLSQGRTRAEALESIREAIEGYLAVLAEHGDPIPEEDAVLIEVVI